MADFHYENARLAALYDLDSPWSVDRDFYLSLASKPQQKILDLGCGTGLLCNAYAKKNHSVTGVDPSQAMLDVAQQKPHGNQIEWVRSTAQDFQSESVFDLIIMTGHAFQTLLDDAEILASLKVMRRHLKSEGSIVFESRNPAIEWAPKWDYDLNLETPVGIVRESRRFLAHQNDLMTFELRYQFPDQALISQSQLRFLSRRKIEELLGLADLHVHKVLGDWDGSPFEESTSEEMIFIVKTLPAKR